MHHSLNHSPLVPALALSAAFAFPAMAHQHFAAGVVDANSNGIADAGEALQFAQGNPETGVFHLLARPTGQRCGGHYMLDEAARTLFPADAFSITSLSDGQYEVATPGHPATGSWIWAEIVSVTGPAGAKFGFWETGANAVTREFTANQPTDAYPFVVSEGIDDPAEDPFGHIHGRAWTANLPGEYVVGIRLVDRSTSGPGGGPWHQPSRIYQFRFSAGPSFQPALSRGENGVTLTWPGRMGIWQAGGQSGVNFKIMRCTSLAPADWQQIGTATATTAETVSFTDAAPPPFRAFYRLEYTWAAP